MKILRRRTPPIKHELKIRMEVARVENSISAKQRVAHRSIKRRKKYSEIILQKYYDLVDSVTTILTSNNFIIYSSKQSKKRSAHYIDFSPVTESGEILDSVRFVFKIGDHITKGQENPGTHSECIVKSFVLKDKEYSGMIAIFNDIRKICDELRMGDYSSLD